MNNYHGSINPVDVLLHLTVNNNNRFMRASVATKEESWKTMDGNRDLIRFMNIIRAITHCPSSAQFSLVVR